MTSATSLSPRHCPSGCGALQRFAFRGVTLDRCSECAGLWFDGREYENLCRLPEAAFHTLEGLAAPATAPTPSAGERHCPSCVVPLAPLRLHHAPIVRVTLDRCGLCGGLWAEEGELEALSQALEAHKPSFEADMPDAVRLEVAQAVAEKLAPPPPPHAHLFQSLVAWVLHRPPSE